MKNEIVVTSKEEIRDIMYDCLTEFFNNSLVTGKNGNPSEYIRSIAELASFLGCSISTAQKFKNNHTEIFRQVGRKFLVSKSDVLLKMKL
jgi:hypothetical protein